MAKVKTSTASLDISYFLTFFESLNCPLITVDRDNKTVDIDNNVTIAITVGSNVNYSRNFTFTENGSSWTSGQYYPVTIIACYSDKFVFLKIVSQNSTTTYTTYIYEKNGSDIYSGHYLGSSASCDINSITTLNKYDSLDTYKYGVMLNYSNFTGYIDHTDLRLLTSNNEITSILDENFLACSTVTFNQVITFEGKNYYCIGTHTLVPLDSEE